MAASGVSHPVHVRQRPDIPVGHHRHVQTLAYGPDCLQIDRLAALVLGAAVDSDEAHTGSLTS